MNRIILSGRLGRDPEMFYFPSGDACTKFSLAVDKGYGENKSVDWFNIETTKLQAESCNEYLSKGNFVIVEGRMTSDKGDSKTFWTVKYARVEFGPKQKEEAGF